MYQAIELAQFYKCYHDERAWPLFQKLVYEASHWDTLDWIAGRLISPLVRRYRHFESELIQWTQADSLWVRRAALLAHLHHGNDTNTKLLSETILKLAPEKEFFIRKAIGWVLRDVSAADPQWVKNFVYDHQTKLSGLSRREALKRISR
jgi:3-methyladenine DNA glycosylase AlkD